jgi:Ca2+-transporting ATPase
MEKWIIRGDPTDKALLRAGIEAGLNKTEIEKKLLKIGEIEFSSKNKYAAKLYQTKEKELLLYISGAPEKILNFSVYLKINNEHKKLSSASRQKIKEKLEELTGKGLRVIAVAYKKIPSENETQILKLKDKKYNLEELLNDLTFVGLIALKDPLRKGVKKAIDLCRQAGMRPIIVTGDHKLTAKAIAQEIGLKANEENVLEGKDLDNISDEELAKKLENIKIYARVEPRHKMRIINAWQQKGEVVAMTGDGINDVPALKKADIGVALGSGTDVAKEVSDLILLTDSFDIIVAAVEEGRVIIDNIRKVVTYLLSDSFTEVILISISLLFGWPLPVTAAQILWVNLIEDGPLGISLAFEPKEKDVMKQKPQNHNTPLLTQEMKALIFIIGFITDLLLLGLFFWLLKYSGYEISHIRSIIFACLTIDSIFYVFSCKSLRRNLWDINLFSNKFLIWSWFFGVLALITALYFPPLQTLLKTTPLNLFDWQLILGLGLINIMLIEATKWYFITKKYFN